MADKLQFVIPGKPQYITIVRLAVGSAANTAGFDVEEIEDIKTAVGEACKTSAATDRKDLPSSIR